VGLRVPEGDTPSTAVPCWEIAGNGEKTISGRPDGADLVGRTHDTCTTGSVLHAGTRALRGHRSFLTVLLPR
jgi:hypothetical protein